MEADVCDENSSPTLVNQTDKTVSITEGSRPTSWVVGLTSVENVTDIVNQAVFHSDVKPENDHDDLNQNEPDDYYSDIISADGSIGSEDVDVNDISSEQVRPSDFGITDTGFANRAQGETCSFVDLPFVPKFEFSLDSSENENEPASNYGILRVNRFISNNIPRPDKYFTIPPPNFKPLDIKPSLDFVDPVHALVLNPEIPDLPYISQDENVIASSQNLHENDASIRPNVNVDEALISLPGPSKEKDPVVDWLDENGDPVPGAFDYVKPDEESRLDVKNAKVEYVFSVREKKDVLVKSNEPSDVVDSGFLINQNVLHTNVAGNLGVPLENQLVPDPSGIAKKIIDDEEKKLYEASKSGAEYKAAVEAVTASSSSTDTSSSISRVIPGNENTKKDQITRFRRNRFTDLRKEEASADEKSEERPLKSKEEVALESQAVTEILKEVQRGAARAKEFGALGWQKCSLPVTNKTFLRNTLVSTLKEPYQPPGNHGRFHVGLKKDEDKGKHQGKREHSSSRSSRSSRSHSSSYSGSSHTDDGHSGSRYKHKHFQQGGGRGSWHRGQYYDEAWAAYAAHYGYPWYGPEALPMFYGPEGWPMDPYAAMYYGDAQAWMEYEAFYGPSNFNSRGMGRGFRGRGRGGYEGGFRGYNREYSRSRSRSRLSSSWSRDHSQSSSRSRLQSGDSRARSRSRSLSHGCARSQSRSHHKSRDKSLRRDSKDKKDSDVETNEKKKKKKNKKKKKKHKKSKKVKHRQKYEENKSKEKDIEGIVEDGAERENIHEKDGSKEKLEEKTEANDEDLRKEGGAVKQEEKKAHQKQKNQDKSVKDSKNKKKERKKVVSEDSKGKDGSKVSGNVAEINKSARKNVKKDKAVTESNKIYLENQKRDRQATDIKDLKKRDETNSTKDERISDSYDRNNRNKRSDSQDNEETEGIGKSKHEGKDNTTGIRARDRSISQDSRKRISDYKDGRGISTNITERDRRSESHDSRERARILGHKHKLGGDGTMAEDGSGDGSKRTRISDPRDKERDPSNTERGGKYDNGERNRKDGHITERNRKGGHITERNRSESHDTWESHVSKEIYEKGSRKHKQGKDITERDRSGSGDSGERTRKDDFKYKQGRDIVDKNRSEKDRKSLDNRERNKLDGGKKSLQTGKEGETGDQKIISIRHDGQGKRRKNTSTDNNDENVDKKQTGKVVGVTGGSSQGQRESKTDNAKYDSKEKHKESRSGNGEHSQRQVKKDIKDRTKNDEHSAVEKNVKDSSYEKYSERKSDSRDEHKRKEKYKESRNGIEGDQRQVEKDSKGDNYIADKDMKDGSCEKRIGIQSWETERSCAHGYHGEKEKSCQHKEDSESKQPNSDKCKENSKHEKPRHNKIVNPTQQNKESGLTNSSKGIEITDLDLTWKSSVNADVSITEKHPDINNAATKVNKNVAEYVEGVKRKYVVKKQATAKKMKPNDAVETESKSFLPDGGGESSELWKKELKLKTKRKLKEQSQEGKYEKTADAVVE